MEFEADLQRYTRTSETNDYNDISEWNSFCFLLNVPQLKTQSTYYKR